MLEDENEQLKSDKSVCENQLLDVNDHLMAAESSLGKSKSSVREISDLRSKGLLKIEELAAELENSESENNELAKTVKAATSRLDEVKQKLHGKIMDFDAVSDKLRRTGAELTTTRNDAEGMLKVMGGMEQQLSEFQAREDGISALSKDCQQKVEEHILQRDQANVKYNTVRKEVAKLLEERRRMIEEKGRDNEMVVEAVSVKFQAVIESSKREVHELVVQNSRLKGEAERARREQSRSDALYLKVKGVLDGEREGLRGKFEATTRRIGEAESRCELEGSQNRANAIQVKNLQNELDKKEASLGEAKGRLERCEMKWQGDFDSQAKKLREAEDNVEAKKFEVDKLGIMVEEARNTSTHRLNESLKRAEMERDDAKLAAEGVRAFARDRETSMQEAVENSAKVAERSRKDKDLLMEQMEKKLSEEREVGSRMTTRNQELGVRVNLLAAEKAELNVIAAEAEGRLEEVEGERGEMEVRVEELEGQLRGFVGEMEKKIQVEGGLKAEVNRLLSEVARLKR